MAVLYDPIDRVQHSNAEWLESRRPSTLPLLALASGGSQYIGLKTRTIMARRERAAEGEAKNYEVRPHRSGEYMSA